MCCLMMRRSASERVGLSSGSLVVKMKAKPSIRMSMLTRKRAASEKRLRKHQEQLTGIIASAMDAIITVDQNQQVVMFNRAAEKIFGCSEKEAIGGTARPLSSFLLSGGSHRAYPQVCTNRDYKPYHERPAKSARGAGRRHRVSH
jgi:PAS domain S-box-containing protein